MTIETAESGGSLVANVSSEVGEERAWLAFDWLIFRGLLMKLNKRLPIRNTVACGTAILMGAVTQGQTGTGYVLGNIPDGKGGIAGTISMLDAGGHVKFDSGGRIASASGRLEYKSTDPNGLYMGFEFEMDRHTANGGVRVSDLIVEFRQESVSGELQQYVFIDKLEVTSSRFQFAVAGDGGAVTEGETVVEAQSVVNGRLQLQLLELGTSKKHRHYSVRLVRPLQGKLLEIPETVTGLAAYAGNGNVSLTWTPSPGATSYDIYRRAASGIEGATPDIEGITATSYIDSGLKNDFTYYYDVVTVGPGGNSPHAIAVSAVPGLDSLIAMLKDPVAATRLRAVTELMTFKDVRTLKPLASAIGDADSGVRTAAVYGLVDQKDPRAVPPLIAMLKDHESDVRLKAVNALGLLGDKRATQPLIGQIGDGEAAVRTAAIESLGNLNDKTAATTLVKLLHDPDPKIRGLSVSALGQIKAATAAKSLAFMLKTETNADLKSKILVALTQITGKHLRSYTEWNAYLNPKQQAGSH